MGSRVPRILIVDDTPTYVELLSAALTGLGCELMVANNGERALALATSRPPDLVLLDVLMPGLDGFEACRQLKATPATAEVPVIFVTGRSEEVSQGFAAGGADYIAKPIQAEEVRARVRYQLERRGLLAELKELNRVLEDKVRERTAELTVANRQLRREVNERRYMQERLNYLATHDFVTRLYNRDALDAHLTRLLARAQTEDVRAVFLLVDIDQFRLINECCGCIAGDELLRAFGDLLAHQLSRADFVARLGGDRFGVVSEMGEGEHGLALARLITRHASDFEFRWEDRRFKLAASVAVVPLTPSIVSFDQLMLMADEAAYLAKQDGRGAIQLHAGGAAKDAGMAQRETVNWALVLLDALEHGHLRAYFQCLQPMPTAVRVHREGGLRAEALIRLWDSATQSLVPPGYFIPPAERYHLVGELDRWMLREVITLLGSDPGLHTLIAQVTVNLSALSIREPGLAEYVAGLLKRHGVPPNLLCFEITETEAIVNLQRAREFMQTLHAMGCHFSLDDFGSGFASFGYLRELPFDTLKIDGLFVRDMDQDPTHAAMVHSMVEMARLLGKPVVAECVETEAVARALDGLGVTWCQGFLFHRPEALHPDALREQALLARARLVAMQALAGAPAAAPSPVPAQAVRADGVGDEPPTKAPSD